ncbi:unnamed protein product [Urochloa decumbens]|uniref:F-box domain-containing protein n=1 Tax=Urochloa decumbens TaxID=240449 RepID=A0ABC9G2E9_9POAL
MASALARDADPLVNDGVLPTDALYEVLLRIPAKALCRLRLVCRSWRSLTSDPRFARAHSARHPLFVGLNLREAEIHIVDLYSGNIVKRIYSANMAERVNGIGDLSMHLSTQAGLVCVSTSMNNGARDIVLNPTTGAVNILPNGNRPNTVSSCILGHVPSTREYKVLRLSYYNTAKANNRVAFEVIALAGGGGQRWRVKPSPVNISAYFRRIAVVHGVAYFSVRKSSDNDDNDDGSSMVPNIALFNLATEEWRPTTLPGPISKHLYQEGDVTQFDCLDGFLAIIHHKKRSDCSTDIWFLMHVDMDSSRPYWTKRYSMRCVSHWKHATFYPPRPLVILDDGRIVASLEMQYALRVYDPSTDTWEDLTKLGDYFAIRMHHGSLLCSHC